MDHETAVQLQAPERYILGDLAKAERDEFEDHAADCSRCMRELATADIFAANTCAVFQDEAMGRSAAKSRWFDLPKLWPARTLAFSGALNLVLLGAAGYGLLRVNTFESRLQRYEAPAVSEEFTLHAQTRGAGEGLVLHRSRPAVLNFDLARHYPRYAFSLRDVGRSSSRSSGDLAVPSDADTLHLTVPTAGLEPGSYELVLTGSDGAKSEEIDRRMLRVEP